MAIGHFQSRLLCVLISDNILIPITFININLQKLYIENAYTLNRLFGLYRSMQTHMYIYHIMHIFTRIYVVERVKLIMMCHREYIVVKIDINYSIKLALVDRSGHTRFNRLFAHANMRFIFSS